MDDGRMDDGWMMDGWMDDGWMDGWMEEYFSSRGPPCLYPVCDSNL